MLIMVTFLPEDFKSKESNNFNKLYVKIRSPFTSRNNSHIVCV